MPLCYGCDDPVKGSLARWNPETGDIQRDLGTERLNQDTLALTGETIAPARRPDYPVLTNGDDHPNVVTFNARVIYYNARSLEIDSVHWVADGWQILIEHPDRAVLLDRTGVKRELTLDDQFLVGTPDGWFGTRPLAGSDAVEVVHHTLTDLTGKVIARFYHPVGVLDAPALGATATQGGFPDVPSPVARITCPNTLPPRLFVGGKGRVDRWRRLPAPRAVAQCRDHADDHRSDLRRARRTQLRPDRHRVVGGGHRWLARLDGGEQGRQLSVGAGDRLSDCS